jgi:hypothetical protein
MIAPFATGEQFGQGGESAAVLVDVARGLVQQGDE